MQPSLTSPATRRLLLTGLLGFFVIGALQAAYGPALPGLERRFEVGLDVLGQALALHFAGSFVTIAITGPLLTRVGYRRPLLAGTTLMVLAAAIVILAPSLPWFFLGAVLGGLGFGMADVTLNLVVARAFAPNAAPALNLLNAFFGIGSVSAPAAVAFSGGSILAPMLIVAVTGAAMLLLTWSLLEPERPARASGAIPWFAAAGFLVLYFLYVTSEAGIGSWETVHLAPTLGEQAAAFNTSMYWAALTLGRFAAIPLSARIRSSTLVVGATVLALVGVAATHLPALAPFAYPVVGFALAPIFPTGIAWIQRVFPSRSEVVVSTVFATATLGPVATSGLIGALVESAGPSVIPTVFTLVGVGMVSVAALLWASTRAK